MMTQLLREKGRIDPETGQPHVVSPSRARA